MSTESIPPARLPWLTRRCPRLTLFRFATAGSVDDGKSTLVGRLLHDSKAILADQLDAVARTSADRGFGGETGGDRPRAADRRPARRARAGHHHRRRLPLLRHGPPQLHPRGLPRARAVHQEHGDRRVHRGRRRRAHRRPQGCPGADPPAPVRAAAAARGPRDRRREQDRPRGLQRGRVPRDRGRRPAGRAASSGSVPMALPTSGSSPCPRSTATTWSIARSAPRGTTARRCSKSWRRCRPPTNSKATWRASASRSSWWSGRRAHWLPTPSPADSTSKATATTAPTPARSPKARSRWGTRSAS